MERWNPYVTELMLFPNSNTLLCQAKELCWPRGQGPPLSLAGRAQELRADMKLLASEGGKKVWVVTSAKQQGAEKGGAQTVQLSCPPATRCHCEGGFSVLGEDGERRNMGDGGGWVGAWRQPQLHLWR